MTGSGWTRKHTAFLDTGVLVCLAAFLIWPLFRLEYLDNRASIESTFIADARMLRDHFPHPFWQPLWYCGTRFDYIYPPALRYGTALLSALAGVSTARGYHLYTAFWYVFGIAAVYWLVRAGSGSRGAGLLSAAGVSLLSPSFLFMPAIRADSGFWVPQRLHVLMRYGEGPHISALCILTAALALSFIALRRWNPATFAGSAALCALAVSNNFYGATSLAIFFPFVVWSVWLGRNRWTVWARAGGVALLAWGLCAFWLSPSYLAITLVNLKWVSQPGNRWSVWVALAFALLFCGISWKAGRQRPRREWTIFVTGSALLLSLNVIGLDTFGFRVAGDSYRLIPELDLALMLLFAEGVRHVWQHPKGRLAAALMMVAAFFPAVRYLRHRWSPFTQASTVQGSYEYQIGQWVNAHLPGERVFVSGSARFWFDAWFDNAQPDGGSDQGMLNQILPIGSWQILKGKQPAPSTLWLQALGTDAIAVAGKNSLDVYRDFDYPQKFAGALTALYDNGHDSVIYRVPRLHTGIARVVRKAAVLAIGPVRGGDDIETLGKYVAVIEDPTQPASAVHWHDFEHAEVQGSTAPGQVLLVQETYDPDWRAWQNGREVQVEREPVMGFMMIDVPAGEHSVALWFTESGSGLAGRLVSIASGILLCGLLGFHVGARSARDRASKTPV